MKRMLIVYRTSKAADRNDFCSQVEIEAPELADLHLIAEDYCDRMSPDACYDLVEIYHKPAA